MATDSLPPAPNIRIKNTKDSTAYLGLHKLAISIKIIGNTAITTLDMTFYNGFDRTMEGELNFPLAENQAVTRYALDVNGVLREGVTVEKQQGRVAYENTIRQRIDPGLLEMTEGNNFRSRIYPLNPKGFKRVVIAYQEELNTVLENENPNQNTNQNLAWHYKMPLNFRDKITDFSLTVEVLKTNLAPKFMQNPFINSSFNFVLDTKTGNYVANYTQKNAVALGWFRFIVPIQTTASTVITETKGDETYFFAQYFPKKDTKIGITNLLPTTKAKKNILLVWDISHSGKNRNLSKEMELLELYVSKLKDFSINLVLFSNKIQLQKTFSIKNADWTALKTLLQNAEYDGGTQLGLSLQKTQADETWLFTDGLSNFGDSEMKLPTCPALVFCSSTSANYAYLRYVAQKTNGTFFNLIETAPTQVLEQLANPPLRFIGADYDKTQISEVYPNLPQDFTGQLAVNGILKVEKATLVLKFGYGNIVTHKEIIVLQNDKYAKKSNEGEIAKLWAAKKVAFLDRQPEKNKVAITALGKEFALVTRYTSLIVLDRIEDYIRYDITPPAELREEYKRLLKNRTVSNTETLKNKQKEEERAMENVLDDWEDRIDWWQEPKPVVKKVVQNTLQNRENTQVIQQPNNNAQTTTHTSAVQQRAIAAQSRPMTEAEKNMLFKNPNLQDKLQNPTTIYGKVISADDGEALPGVTVTIKGTPIGTQTDVEGVYILAADSTAILVVSFIGYQSSEISAKSAKFNIITLKSDEKQLSEVVVVGFGTTEKRSVTSSITRVTSQTIDNQLAGKIAGVQITQGVAGASTMRTICGVTSTIKIGTEPLYVFDGIPVENISADISPNDIFSIEVLKGEFATALYGSRAANGAILITTKKGTVNQYDLRDSLDRKLEEITVKKVLMSDTPYLDTLSQVTHFQRYTTYLRMKKEFGSSSAFYLDVADFFADKKDKQTALRILSTLVELEAENPELMRIVARRLQQLGEVKLAITIFEKLLEIRAEELQTHRDLALAYAENGQSQKALDMLYAILKKDWDNNDANDLKETVLYEMNNVIARAKKPLNLKKIDKNLIKSMPVDVRITLDWSNNDMDIDLYLINPKGEECSYHDQTKFGAYLSEDITNGYGPEEILLKKAEKGKYKVKVDYYASNIQKQATPIVLQLSMYMYYGTPKQTKKTVTIRLSADKKDELEVGSFVFE